MLNGKLVFSEAHRFPRISITMQHRHKIFVMETPVSPVLCSGSKCERIKPGFRMIVGDRSRSLGSLVNCSAIVTIIWKPNFHFASDRQRFQRLPTIAMITITEIESESISAIIAIVNDRQRSQKVNGNHQCSDCSDRNDSSDHVEIIAQRSQRS